MAEKYKLPPVAIELIVRMRNDRFHNHTYEDIANRINNEFGVSVTKQAIYYHYKRNKDMQLSGISTAVPSKQIPVADRNVEKNQQSVVPKLPRQNINQNLNKRKEYDTSYSDNLTSEDIEELLKTK
ncbi:hypothetical protein WDM69_09810 (plasmid) [Moraxella lincolnii]|uniref:hypothetical protein n=1 Tax=Lwoffella lincolnii TaxID=90241 RepID=UPI0030D3217E